MRLNGFRSSRAISLSLAFGVFGLVALALAGYDSAALAADEEPTAPAQASGSQQQASNDFQEGLAWRDRGNYYRAIDFFTKAIAARPDWPLALATRALMYSNFNWPDHAIAEAQKVSEIDATDAESYLARGIARYVLARSTKAPLEDYDAALDDLSRAVKLEPKNAQGYAMRGRVKAALKHKSGALPDCNKAIKLRPTSDNYRIRASVKRIGEDYQGALQDYAKAIELNPIGTNYLIRALAKRYSLKDDKGAVQDYTKAIELLDPKADALALAFAYSQRGSLRENKDDLDGTKEDWSRALELSPEWDWLRDKLAVLRRRQLVAAGLAQPKTIVVAEDGSGDSASISQALQRAIPGDIIALRPGTYAALSISTDGVNLVGLGPDPSGVVIEGRVFLKDGAKQVKLESFTVRGITILDSADVTLQNLRVVGKEDKYAGIYASGSQGVLIEDGRISGWPDGGVSVTGASRVKLERNLIADNQTGVSIRDGSKASLEGNTIVNNASERKHVASGCGVHVSAQKGAKTEAQLYNNIIAWNDTGILFHDKARCEMSYNNAYGNSDGNYAMYKYKRLYRGRLWGYQRHSISTESNLSINPLFVDRFAGDYRLRADSPLVNKGTGGSYMGAFPPAGLSLAEEEFE